MKKKETPEDTAVGADGQDSNDGVDKDESIEDTVDLSQEIDHYKSIAQRAQADLVNYRNRAIQELEESKRRATQTSAV